jgi:hypothetical protein
MMVMLEQWIQAHLLRPRKETAIRKIPHLQKEQEEEEGDQVVQVVGPTLVREGKEIEKEAVPIPQTRSVTCNSSKQIFLYSPL